MLVALVKYEKNSTFFKCCIEVLLIQRLQNGYGINQCIFSTTEIHPQLQLHSQQFFCELKKCNAYNTVKLVQFIHECTLFEIFIFCPKFNFHFPRKLSIFLGVKNSWKCWGFVKIEFLDKNLTFIIVWLGEPQCTQLLVNDVLKLLKLLRLHSKCIFSLLYFKVWNVTQILRIGVINGQITSCIVTGFIVKCRALGDLFSIRIGQDAKIKTILSSKTKKKDDRSSSFCGSVTIS